MNQKVSSSDSNTAKPQSPRRLFVLVILAFIFPVILAKLALDQDWFNRASTNRGELMTPPVEMDPVLATLSPKWRLLYRLPGECNQSCENAIYSIQQVWLALGRETDRVEALVVATQDSDNVALERVNQAPNVNVFTADKEIVNKLFNDFSGNGIFIVDTQNNAMLRYQVSDDKAQAVLDSRDVLADLKKLLKLSRIG